MLRVMVADDSNEYAELLREGLHVAGHTVVAGLLLKQALLFVARRF